MPKRAESKRGAPNVIISMAQQARPKVAGHSEDLRVQLTSFSTLASSTPSGNFSSRPISVPVQPAAAPHIGVRDEHSDDEDDDLDQPEQAERPIGHGVRVKEDDLDVEDDEQHRRQEVLDRESVWTERLRRRFDAALVEVHLRLVVAARPGKRGDHHGKRGEPERQQEQQQDRQIRREHVERSPFSRWVLAGVGADVVAQVSPGDIGWIRGLACRAYLNAGVNRVRTWIARSDRSPSWGSLRLASSLSTKRIRAGCGRPWRVQARITSGRPMSFTNSPPKR